MKIIDDPEIVYLITDKWGGGKNGANQFLAHTLGKRVGEPARFAALEYKAGLPSGTLTGILSSDISEIITSLKEFDKLADKVIANNIHKVVLEGGKKEIFWFKLDKSTHNNKVTGIEVIRYDNKLRTMMPRKQGDFERQYDEFIKSQ